MSYTLRNLVCCGPDATITAPLLFDLATQRLSYRGAPNGELRDIQLTVAAGFELLGLGDSSLGETWRDLESGHSDLEGALALETFTFDPERSEAAFARTSVLTGLWMLRQQVLSLPLNWVHVIEGNPARQLLPRRDPRSEEIADRVLGMAAGAVGIADSLDVMLLEAYGAPTPLPTATYRQLAHACPAAVRLNGGWHGPADFGLPNDGDPAKVGPGGGEEESE